MFQKVKYSSLNELIYEEIKRKIINNELKPMKSWMWII